jgi:hypothetical protein
MNFVRNQKSAAARAMNINLVWVNAIAHAADYIQGRKSAVARAMNMNLVWDNAIARAADENQGVKNRRCACNEHESELFQRHCACSGCCFGMNQPRFVHAIAAIIKGISKIELAIVRSRHRIAGGIR